MSWGGKKVRLPQKSKASRDALKYAKYHGLHKLVGHRSHMSEAELIRNYDHSKRRTKV